MLTVKRHATSRVPTRIEFHDTPKAADLHETSSGTPENAYKLQEVRPDGVNLTRFWGRFSSSKVVARTGGSKDRVL